MPVELKALGALLDAGIGSTRPAVWNSWFSEHQLIGLSGQIIAPNVCIVFGASGCTPFIKGIESRLLVAVNQDPNALIFSHCDLELVDDCREIIAELMKLV
ncbi:MAG: hypothetical protein HFH24_00290 [Ruminococcus sp.]|nr:hypothetical protein [Ruminococcus sp.]